MSDPLRKAAWRVAPGAMAERAHRFQIALHERRGLRAASQRVAAEFGEEVIRGPFAGMRYPAPRVASLAKRVGAYEHELYAWFETALAASPTRFVDIGAADGFYAVGVARRGIPVDAFELSRTARGEIAELAALNGARVTIRGRATPSALAQLDLAGALVLSDCEGAELELLDATRLRATTVIVEVHEDVHTGAEHILRARFAATHAIDALHPTDRDPGAFPELAGLSAEMRARALGEGRTMRTPWLRMTPRP